MLFYNTKTHMAIKAKHNIVFRYNIKSFHRALLKNDKKIMRTKFYTKNCVK